MKIKLLAVLVILLSLQGFSQNTVNCVIRTSEGNIKLELYREKAPITVDNFLLYVDSSLYNNSSFFRVCTPENEAEREVKIEVIQGGLDDEKSSLDPIELETTLQTNIFHKNGTISMARETPNSATNSFFICINDQPELDYKGKRNPDGQGFAAFGRVIDGMDVVHKIQNKKNKDQTLLETVTIFSIDRAK